MFLHIDRILIKVVFWIEIGPHQEGEKHCFFNPVQETLPHVFGFYVGVESKEAAESEAPFNWCESVGVPEDVFGLQVVHFFYCQPVVFSLH